jgi:ATP-dependent Clp protease adaptor protein ClpS
MFRWNVLVDQYRRFLFEEKMLILHPFFTYAQANPANPDVEIVPEQDEMIWNEQPYRVLIHNDDVTTFDFVIRMLQSVFKLSREIAEHIALVTHHQDIALVCVRPRSEAEKLVGQGIFAARIEGFPLMLSCEPEA